MLNILNVARTGLSTAQTQVEGVTNNLANENTPGYKKRVVDVSELDNVSSMLAGRGVFVDGISRKTDIYVYQHVVKEEAKLNNLSETDMMLSDIESIFTETDTSGLSADLNRYFTSIENLRTSPDNPIYKNDLTNNGNILVGDLQSLYDGIEQKESTTLDKAKSTVTEINNILKHIGSISQDILESTGGTPNDLLDKRDLLEKQLAKYVDVDASNIDNNYSLKIGGRTAISFGTNVHTVNLVENYTPQQDMYTKLNSDGVTQTPLESNIIESTWGANDAVNVATAEIQVIPITGTATAQVKFLGHTVANADGTAGHQTSAEIIADIIADAGADGDASGASIIGTWNTANPTKQINTITAVDSDGDGTNDAVKITYLNTEGNVDNITTTTPSNGIAFNTTIESTRGSYVATSAIQEVQTLQLTGTSTGQVFFLGHLVNSSVSGEDNIATAGRIVADKNKIISNWNNDPSNANKQIQDIADDGTNTGNLKITYKSHMGDVAVFDETSSRGIIYNRSVETTQGTQEDSITYTLNNTYDITVTNGEVIYNTDGTIADINGDGTGDTSDTVDSLNIVKALVYKINHNSETGGLITAYNGKYELAEDGTKILTNDSRHSQYDATSPNKDRYLFIESNTDGEAGKFVGEINVKDNANKDTDIHSDTYGKYIGKSIEKDTLASKEGLNDIHLEILEKELYTTGGTINPMINNLKTESGKNDFNVYKDMLDNFAKKLSDYSSAFIEATDGTYISGLDASQVDGNNSITTHVGLFKGANVKSLEFNDNISNTLTQQKLDYLATMQWDTNIDFDSTGLNNASFSSYYQTLRVDIADTRENVIFNKESQSAITESLNNTYEKLTKVDKDEEMVNLIKFQSAYSANAKVITAIDEMLSTLLNMKR